MIDIKLLTPADKGREVRYRTASRVEYGKITDWNDRFVFVRYHTVIDPARCVHTRTAGETPMATYPINLDFVK